MPDLDLSTSFNEDAFRHVRDLCGRFREVAGELLSAAEHIEVLLGRTLGEPTDFRPIDTAAVVNEHFDVLRLKAGDRARIVSRLRDISGKWKLPVQDHMVGWDEPWFCAQAYFVLRKRLERDREMLGDIRRK